MAQPEKELVMQVAQYLQMQYPNVIYRFDLAADMKLTVGQAARNKRLHCHRGYPDLFIAEPRGGFNGLFIELKAVPIYKRDGSLKTSEHLREQQAYHDTLVIKGYAACFAVGFDEAKDIIDKYMKL